MKENTGQKGRFKTKGASILNSSQPGPKSMKEFLDVSMDESDAEHTTKHINTQNHKTAFAQDHTSTKPQGHETLESTKGESTKSKGSKSEKIERLHVHIRKDLADKHLEMVFRRKCDRKIRKKKATQRVIIEEALEEYFSKRDL